MSQIRPYRARGDDGIWQAHKLLPVIRGEDLSALQDGSKGCDGSLFLKCLHHLVAVLVPQTAVAVPDAVNILFYERRRKRESCFSGLNGQSTESLRSSPFFLPSLPSLPPSFLIQTSDVPSGTPNPPARTNYPSRACEPHTHIYAVPLLPSLPPFLPKQVMCHQKRRRHQHERIAHPERVCRAP